MIQLPPPHFTVGHTHRHRRGFSEAQRRRLLWMQQYPFGAAGGSATSFSPLALPSLTSWYDASSAGSLSGDGAVALVSASSQSLTAVSNSVLQTGNVSQWFSVVVNATSFPADAGIISKDSTTGGGREYTLGYDSSLQWFFQIGDGTSLKTVSSGGGVPSTGTNYHLFGYYDPVAAVVGLYVNGTLYTTSTAGFTPATTSTQFAIGLFGNNLYWNGSLACVCGGKNVPGGFAITSAATIMAALRNGGNFLDVRDITASQKTAWGATFGYPFGSSTNLLNDIIGTNTLTNNGAAIYAAGPVTSKNLTNNDAVSQINDLSGLGNHLVQATAANRPLYIVNGAPNGTKPCVRFTAVNSQYMVANFTLNAPSTSCLAGTLRTNTSNVTLLGGGSANVAGYLKSLTGNWSQSGNSSGIASDTNPHLFCVLNNGASSFLVVDTTQGLTNNPGGAAVGGFAVAAKGSGGQPCDLDFFEGVTCGTNLAFVQCVQLDGYIKPKWGTT